MFEYTKRDTEKKNSKKLSSSSNLTGIPDTMKSRFENLSGFSFDDVRVHYNSDKPAQFKALAYTQGNRVYISSGQEKHLGHELGHVIQQKRGIVKPTLVTENIKINNDRGLEKEADYINMKTIQRYTPSENYTEQLKQIIPQSSLVQCADPVEKAIMPENFDSVRDDINNAMLKIKNTINNWAIVNDDVMKKLTKTIGRDAWVYAPSSRGILKDLLNSWDVSWTFENTCGLLLDLGNALRSFTEQITTMNPFMEESRDSDKHKINKKSKWVKGLPKGAKTMSGVSATTGNLLRTLAFLSKDIKLQLVDIEAIIIGVIKYWKFEAWTIPNFKKKMSGSYHTASEVWSVYTYFLENKLIKGFTETINTDTY